MSHLSIEIDRLILTDLDLTTLQAEALRPLLEAELALRVERGGLPVAAHGFEAHHVQAPAVQLNANHGQLVNGLAQSISQSLTAL